MDMCDLSRVQDIMMVVVMQIAEGVVTVKGALTEAKVLIPDLKACTNTVVHVVDTVIVPCHPEFSKLLKNYQETCLS